jgi:hypothetical protein
MQQHTTISWVLEAFIHTCMYRAFFHHFGNMTYTPGIGKFRIILPEIGKFFASLGNKKLYTYLILSIIPGFKKQMMPD